MKVVPPTLDGDQLSTNIEFIKARIESLGEDSILAVVSTTSCFAPRGADRFKT